jgi:imidazolonepropionase-like amidohydrolase
MMHRLIKGLACTGALALASVATAQDSWVIRADTVYTATGEAIENGHVAIGDGKISSVGPGKGSGRNTLEVFAVTPGMIDLSVRIHTGQFSVEQSSETPIAISMADALDLYSYRWGRELKSGVTTVLASPFDQAVIGGLSVAIKTGGDPTLEARLLKAGAALRASMGSQPSGANRAPRGGPPNSFYFRRPTTRMGVEWVFRNAYYIAILAAKQAVRDPDPRQEERNEILMKTMRGELPVIVQAWATQDIRTAIFLKEEFQIPHMYVDAAAEVWREPDLLARSGMGVILPPHTFDGRTTDGAFFAWDSAARVHELGLPLALSAHGARDIGARLDRQAGFAMRGGLPFEAALEAVTINPARMIGIDDRVGSIEVGKDADLLLWNGKPFEATSRVIGVLLDGELVLDPRPTTDD